MSSHELQSGLILTTEFSKMYYTRYNCYQLCHLKNEYRLETVRNISFLSRMLEMYSEIALFRKPFGIGYKYIYTFLLRITDTMTSQNIDLSSWDTLYNTVLTTCTINFIFRKLCIFPTQHIYVFHMILTINKGMYP
jgi:hypothetical protein